MKIEFSTDNDAFEEYGDKEIRRILEEIADQVERGYGYGPIIDINGNHVGEWSL